MIGPDLKFAAASVACLLSACSTGGAIQPDRSVFNLDGNYQRYEYAFPIEEAFDRTVAVFRDAGYRFDVIDRATGQVSGERAVEKGNTFRGGKGQKIYALILPTPAGRSQVALKIVQTIQVGAIINKSNTELIASDAQMYQYVFRRIESLDPAAGTTTPQLPTQIPD